ncbi:MAG: transcription-repair coupling factor, partial [Candidatus Izemoplasmatales bacterium]
PYRFDFFGDQIDTIKTFDVESQRSIEVVESVDIHPMSDFFFTPADIQKIKTMIKQKMSELTFSESAMKQIQTDMQCLENRQELERLNRYLSLMVDETWTIKDYLNDPDIMFFDYRRILSQYEILIQDQQSWEAHVGDYKKIGFVFFKQLEDISGHRLTYLEYLHASPIRDEAHIMLHSEAPMKYNGDLSLFIQDMKFLPKEQTTLLQLRNSKSQNQMMDLLSEQNISFYVIGERDSIIPFALNIIVSQTYFDVSLSQPRFVCITESALERKHVPRKKGKYVSVYETSKRLASVNDLKHGDYVVHYDYGIGRFLDIKTLELGNTKNDYIHLEYRDGDKLFIPLEAFSQIQKYAGSEGFVPKLSKLGGSDWDRTKHRVRKKAKDIADRLIALYSQREQAQGFGFQSFPEFEEDLEADFPYQETEDQIRAIHEVMRDMETPRPMDRLLCGDVGFGKTEVALRAAFRAVLNNKQVAYLAPTTVLSKQHYHTFSARMARFGVRVVLLNRFIAKKQQNDILRDLKAGNIDVLIGTHRILSRDIDFRDLGLLIIDEEQRFGVEHKERIKELKINVDVLSLSATPIPRTLQMAIMGVKNMSILESAPENRYPIQTYVLERNDAVIKNAIERELSRNGQVFYLYNRVDDIEIIADKIQKLIPEARIQVAHGQMYKHALESVVEEFIDQQIDVLISTTIIETGIDIPNANTLIIHDSDRLGLAQLYQIRGRVGRSDRIAYAYLMYKKDKILTEEAEKRLKVIKEFTELGSGFKIAIRDLSIRGAGDVLGSEQSGFIDSVGIDLYLRILEEEINELQGKKPEMTPAETIKATVSRYIDEEYIADDFVKIEMHKKINQLSTIADISELLSEFQDRFGPYDEELVIYMYERLFEKLTARLGVDRMLEHKTHVALILTEQATHDVAGDAMFMTGERVSRFFRFAYKNQRIQIILDTVGLKRHWLYTMTEFLEVLLMKDKNQPEA